MSSVGSLPRPSWLYSGMVIHHRLRPHEHAFRYPGLFICFPLDQKATLRSRLFSLDRFNLFSFYEKDHGDGHDAESWIRTTLQREGITQADGNIWLLAMPRILGFVFNPVSFWFCHDSADALRAVLCEVRNTFGERHCYLLTARDGGPIGKDTELTSRKVFHVSPFFDVKGHYRFRFNQQPEKRSVAIDYYEDDALSLKTHLSGSAREMTDTELLRTFFSFGWATVLVVWRIHWQALLLWRKKTRFHTKPVPPVQEITR
ncbi:MAG: DUF1365 domain-containing protein [Moraxellaceae bacterium]|nr:DUF1365 domain-containing protein [Moraxellaceae bacterium]